MSNDYLKVADGMVVSLDYILRLSDGREIDGSEEGAPLEYIQGLGHIIHGLEQALAGMKIGDEKSVIVEPEQGFGHHDLEYMEELSLDSFPEDFEIEVGMELDLRDMESGEEFSAVVAEILPESVLLDLNHPLAGETLHFTTRIAGLRPATEEELAHGHVH